MHMPDGQLFVSHMVYTHVTWCIPISNMVYTHLYLDVYVHKCVCQCLCLGMYMCLYLSEYNFALVYIPVCNAGTTCCAGV